MTNQSNESNLHKSGETGQISADLIKKSFGELFVCSFDRSQSHKITLLNLIQFMSHSWFPFLLIRNRFLNLLFQWKFEA